MEIVCENGIKFAELVPETGILEVKCRSRRCGAGNGVVVIHQFDIHSGLIVGTRTFRNPFSGKENQDGNRTPVRSA